MKFDDRKRATSEGGFAVAAATRRLVLLVAVTVALAVPGHALDPKKSITQFTHASWSAKDGIPGPVRAIAQTPDGYLWLGTDAGLYRFDGVRFVERDLGAADRRSGASVLSLCAARDGALWVGGYAGVVAIRDGRVLAYAPDDGVPGGGVTSIAEDASGGIWAAGPYGFSRFDGAAWRRIGADEGYAAPGAQSVCVDGRGDLWVATDGTNFGFGDAVRKNTILTLPAGADRFRPTGEAVGMVWKMCRAPDGVVWMADTSTGRVRPVPSVGASSAGVACDDATLCPVFDTDGALWVGLVAGGVRRVPDMERPAPATRDRFGAADGLSAGIVYASFEDREGNIWFGTAGGLDRFRENKATPYSAREGVSPDQQLAVTATPDGSVWLVVYTQNGVQRFRDGAVEPILLPPYSSKDTTRILSVYADRRGRLMVGGSFKLAEENGGRFTYGRGDGLADGAMVEAIAEDAAGGLWVALSGSDGAPRVLRQREGVWSDVGEGSGLPKFRCRVLSCDASGRMWLGFESGEVAVFENERFRVFSAADGLPGGRVLAVTSDREGHVWVAGQGGLSRFDDGRFRTLTRANGLPGDSVSGIVEDDDGDVWLAGSLGVMRVSPAELESALASPSYRMSGLTLDANDGLRGLPRQNEPFPTAVRAADGQLWFATTGGVAVVDPRRIPTNRVPPPVQIEAVRADGNLLDATSDIRLEPHTRNIELRFAGLSFSAPERVRFKYKLDGYDPDWRGPTDAREVAYTNLAPGTYHFHVLACNDDGVWNEDGASVTVVLLPAYYQTTWFLLLSLAAASALGYAAYRWRVRRVKALLDLQFEERLAERTRIAQELHDTLLQGVLSASMHLFIADGKLDDDSPAKPSVRRVVELMERVAVDGRNAVRGLRTQVDEDALDLGDAIAKLQSDLVPPSGPPVRVVVEGARRSLHPLVRAEAFAVAREALVNALRHAGASSIDVEVEYAPRHLRVVVRDDGRGIDAAVLRSGREGHYGLSGMRERAEKIGARLKVSSRDGAGTEVELHVPRQSAYVADRRNRARS